MIIFDQVYIQVLNKVMEDAQRKENSHTVLEFDRCGTRFLVQEIINSRERFNPLKILQSDWMKGGVTVANSKKCIFLILMLLLLISMFTISIRTTYMYTLEIGCNMYGGLLRKFCNKAY